MDSISQTQSGHLFARVGKSTLTLAEAVSTTGVSDSTFRRAIRSRALAVYRPGGKRGKIFLTPQDLEAWFTRSRRASFGESGK